jgi:hypothetical protein
MGKNLFARCVAVSRYGSSHDSRIRTLSVNRNA